jgi:hypothetical protein
MIPMATQCNDIESLLPTYLDGELAPHDQLSFDHHMADCAACRELIRSEQMYLVRVREMLAPPAMPEGLAERVREALDQVEGGARAARWRSWRAWALPGAASMAAAAALILLVVTESNGPQPTEEPGDHARVAHHGPPSGWTRISLSAPGRAAWRPVQARFEVPVRGRIYEVTMERLSCRNVDVSRHVRVTSGNSELWVATGAVNTVISSVGSTCLVFASDMNLERLIDEVVTSGLVGR